MESIFGNVIHHEIIAEKNIVFFLEYSYTIFIVAIKLGKVFGENRFHPSTM